MPVEFLYAFEAWVGVDDDDSDDDEDAAALLKGGSVSAAMSQPTAGGSAAGTAQAQVGHLPVDDVSLTTASATTSANSTPHGTRLDAADLVTANTEANRQA